VKFGIFHKVFIYTAVFLFVVIGIAVALFYQQFAAFYRMQQIRELRLNYQNLYEDLRGADRDQMLVIAQRFADGNQSFVFQILDEGENIVFLSRNMQGADGRSRLRLTTDGFTIVAQNPQTQIEERGFFSRLALALFAILGVTIILAAIFAKLMVDPIKRLLDDTRKMSQLLPIEPPPRRNDEFGELSHDVHRMYAKLKDTIEALEDENLKRKYFFSAASHELKTPIAAARVLLEGMAANVGDYKNHPKYLVECIKLMDAQSKTIYEILEIVKLSEQYEPKMQTINLKDFLEDISVVGGRVSINVAKNETCTADPLLLKKAVSNVLLNAVQNAPEGGEVEVFSKKTDSGVNLYVKNAGRIDEKILPKLFDPFFRADKARNRKDERTGLGLTIVKKSLELMQIQFRLENTDDSVVFTIELPHAKRALGTVDIRR